MDITVVEMDLNRFRNLMGVGRVSTNQRQSFDRDLIASGLGTCPGWDRDLRSARKRLKCCRVLWPQAVPGLWQGRLINTGIRSDCLDSYPLSNLLPDDSQNTMAPSTNSHPSTRALHADDPLHLVTDVAPPIHLSTTFRFPSNPEDLVPSVDPVVRISTDALALQKTRPG